MTEKENALTGWMPGDDSEVARIITRQHPNIKVSRHAVAAWRKRSANRSPLTPIYIAAFKAVIHNRKSKKP